MLHENERTFNDIADRYYFEPIRSNVEEKVNEVGIEAASSSFRATIMTQVIKLVVA